MAAERDVLELSTKKYGALTVGGNYAKVAEGLNVAAMRIAKPGDIVPAIKDAVRVTETGAPFLLEILVNSAPLPARGKRCEPASCGYCAAAVADFGATAGAGRAAAARAGRYLTMTARSTFAMAESGRRFQTSSLPSSGMPR
jgi:hypothetical protein